MFCRPIEPNQPLLIYVGKQLRGIVMGASQCRRPPCFAPPAKTPFDLARK
jgi:hypothetical protein